MDKKPRILLAEDDPNDAFLMRRALSRLNLENQLIHCENGEEVIAALQERHVLPCLCVLDLKMPRMGGFETLRWIRSKPNFAATAVVIMSASGEPADIKRARALGANDYLVKPSTLAELYTLVEKLVTRWGIR